MPKDKEAIIAQHHNDKVGHHGVQRTLERIIREKVDGSTESAWEDMRVHVKRFIQRCLCYQKDELPKGAH